MCCWFKRKVELVNNDENLSLFNMLLTLKGKWCSAIASQLERSRLAADNALNNIQPQIENIGKLFLSDIKYHYKGSHRSKNNGIL